MHADWIDLFRLLNENEVRYLVIGGYAVAFHGFERYTKDLDVWIARDKANADAVIRSLSAFGADPASLKHKDFLNPKKVIVMGAEPYRVDFIMALDALDFEAAWPDRVERENEGVKINYVSRKHLIHLKTAAGRFIDKRDVDAIRSGGKRNKSMKKKAKSIKKRTKGRKKH